MGEFAAGLEKQWELQNCYFYPPKGTSPKGIKVPLQSLSNTGEWWPGQCRVNNIITTKERKQQILYQPKHPCRAGRLSKIFSFWVSLREWGGETVMARKVWTSKTQGPKLRTEQMLQWGGSSFTEVCAIAVIIWSKTCSLFSLTHWMEITWSFQL